MHLELKLIHVQLHETFLLSRTITEQLTESQLLMYLHKVYIKLLNKRIIMKHMHATEYYIRHIYII